MNEARWTMTFMSLLLLSGVAVLGGCKESDEKSTRRLAKDSVDQADRLIRSSYQPATMTEAEIKASLAAADSTAGRRRLTRQVADRLAREADFSSIERLLEEIDELDKSRLSKDPQAVVRMSRRLVQASESLLSVEQQGSAAAREQQRQCLERAKKTLSEALSGARQAKHRTAQIGPGLLLGTLQLALGRDQRRQLQAQDAEIQVEQRAAVRLLVSLTKLETAAEEMETLLPGAGIALLMEQVEGGGTEAALAERLAAAEDQIAELLGEQEGTITQIEKNKRKAAELYQQYLGATEQANRTHGQERYELRQQAYRYRVGYMQGETKVPGDIYYEGEAELAENKLAIINARLEHAQLRRAQLAQWGEGTKTLAANLRQSPIFEKVQAGRQENSRQRKQLLEKLNDFLAAVKAAENQYQQLRVDAVESYTAAINAFEQAAKACGVAHRKTKTHAEGLANGTRVELAFLWLDDAGHYDVGARAVGLLAGVPETNEAVSSLQRDYENQAVQARASAAKLSQSEHEPAANRKLPVDDREQPMPAGPGVGGPPVGMP